MYKKRNPTIIFFDKILQQLRQKPLATVSTLRFSNPPVMQANVSESPPREMTKRIAVSKSVLSKKATIASGTVP